MSFIFSFFRYSKQSFIVDLVFPPLTLMSAQSEVLEGGDFNEFTYWRQPLPELPDEVDKFVGTYASDKETRKRRPTPAATVASSDQK